MAQHLTSRSPLTEDKCRFTGHLLHLGRAGTPPIFSQPSGALSATLAQCQKCKCTCAPAMQPAHQVRYVEEVKSAPPEIGIHPAEHVGKVQSGDAKPRLDLSLDLFSRAICGVLSLHPVSEQRDSLSHKLKGANLHSWWDVLISGHLLKLCNHKA